MDRTMSEKFVFEAGDSPPVAVVGFPRDWGWSSLSQVLADKLSVTHRWGGKVFCR